MGFPIMPEDVIKFSYSELGQGWLKKIGTIVGRPVLVRIVRDDCPEESIYCIIDLENKSDRETSLAGFGLTTMPSCPSVVISYGAFVVYELQNKGIGKLVHGFRLDLLRWANHKYRGYYNKELKRYMVPFDNMICTVNNDNEAQVKILREYGWARILPGQVTTLWGKQLPYTTCTAPNPL